jgi:hypothetical protein
MFWVCLFPSLCNKVRLQALRESAGSDVIAFEDLPAIQALLESEESEWLLQFLQNGGLLKLIKVWRIAPFFCLCRALGDMIFLSFPPSSSNRFSTRCALQFQKTKMNVWMCSKNVLLLLTASRFLCLVQSYVSLSAFSHYSVALMLLGNFVMCAAKCTSSFFDYCVTFCSLSFTKAMLNDRDCLLSIIDDGTCGDDSLWQIAFNAICNHSSKLTLRIIVVFAVSSY